MKRYPTRNGIAISPHELRLPDSRYEDNEKRRNNHHAHYTASKFGQLAVTQCLRDLERHQYVLPIDTHSWLHATYDPPALPTEEQAAREVIDAYEHGERFKVYNKRCHWYELTDIPPELVDDFVAKYSLVRVFDMAAD